MGNSKSITNIFLGIIAVLLVIVVVQLFRNPFTRTQSINTPSQEEQPGDGWDNDEFSMMGGGGMMGRGNKNGMGMGMGYIDVQKEGSLTSDELTSLETALKEEHKAEDTYQAILNKFGSVWPFNMIIRSEQTHIAAIERIYEVYGIQVPSIEKFSYTPPATIQEACTEGVQGEINNANVYKELIKKTNKEGLIDTFTVLGRTSEYMHKPHLEQCAR